MPKLMRCQYCGILQDEPSGAKTCSRCGGELAFEQDPSPAERESFVRVQMELDQVMAPAGQNIERYLLVTLRTPPQVPISQMAQTKTQRPPLNFAGVLDVSGSMQGEKLEQAKQALRQALVRLSEGDVFSLASFSTQVHKVFAPSEMNEHTRQTVLSALAEMHAEDMTNLCGGLEMGVEQAIGAKKETNLLLLLSDGLANQGETDLEKIGYRARQARQHGIITSTLGLGADYNEALMVEIANQGGGHFHHVEHAREITGFLTTELGDIASLAARETRIHVSVPSGAILMPLSSAYTVEQQGSEGIVTVGDLGTEAELEVPIAVVLPAQSAGSKLSFEGYVSYRSPAGHWLRSTLNRVTVRVVEPSAFRVRDGVAAPVAERVLNHLAASSVLGTARARARDPREAAKQMDAGRSRIRQYATLLGEERAQEEERKMAAEFDLIAGSPLASKQRVAAAFYRTRNPKRAPKSDS